MNENILHRKSRLSNWLILIIFGAMFCSPQLSEAQNYKLNFGLEELQDSQSLPVSKAEMNKDHENRIVTCSQIPAKIEKITATEYLLKEGWQLIEANKLTGSQKSVFDSNNKNLWYSATVPGTVLTSLVNSGVYPDPYYGLNNLSIPDSLCREEWWYRFPLTVPDEIHLKRTWLIFNGINYKADIWLNGNLVGRIAGAFKRGEFDITELINKKAGNMLAVHIFPPSNPGIPHEESSRTNAGPNGGQLCLDGPTFISSEGWDWVPGIRDRNIGIWQDVRLKFTEDVTIGDSQIITDLPLPDTTNAELTIKILVKNHSSKNRLVSLSGKIDSIQFSKKVRLLPNEQQLVVFDTDEFPQLKMKNPQLWWPNGYGEQTLYSLELEAEIERKSSDHKIVRFGIREFLYELAYADKDSMIHRVEFNPIKSAGKVLFNNMERVDVGNGTCVPTLINSTDTMFLTQINSNDNPYLTIKVNDVPIFVRGGNWGMDDGMKRVSREKLEPAFKLHKLANFNMIRNWTGESTEEIFYDLCDEYGMLVWNDFWISTEGYNLEPNDYSLFMDNAADVVKRFRNHPSIAIWCPRNEGYAPALLESKFQELIAIEDGTRYYSANSRDLCLRTSGPWHYLKDQSDYFREIADGFSTELGTPSVPPASTIRSFMSEEDQWPVSDTWYYHDLHDGQKDYFREIENRYGKSKNLDEFCSKAQLVNYDSHRAMFESWNSRMWNNASGLLLWMTHPAWPSMVWQVYSWNYETFGSFYGAKKACGPVHIQMNADNSKIVVVNTTQKYFDGVTASLQVYNALGEELFAQKQLLSIYPNQLSKCDLLNNTPEQYEGQILVRLLLVSADGTELSRNDYWFQKKKQSDGLKPVLLPAESINTEILSRTIIGQTEKLKLRITNNSSFVATAVEPSLYNETLESVILPAYFSDKYFNLLPGESIIVDVEHNLTNQDRMQVNVKGFRWNL